MAPLKHPGSRLRRFRESIGLSLREAARQLHVVHQALMTWESETQVPVGPYREAIEVWTEGKIKASDWPLNSRETEMIDNAALVRPAVPAAAKTGTEG